MSILWCGGEDIDFPNASTIPVETGSTTFRSGYGRCSVRFTASPYVYYKSTTFSGGGVTSCWLSVWWKIDTANAGRMKIGIGKLGTDKGIFLGPATSSGGKVSVATWDGSTRTELAASASTVLINNTLQKIDMQLSSYGGSSTIRVYVDGVLALTFTGDSSISGVSDFDIVVIYTHLSGSGTEYFSEMIVATTDTRAMSLVTHYPNGAGDANAWTGAYTDIDETTISDADLIVVDSDAQDAQFGLSNLPSSSVNVIATKIAARALKTSSATVGTLKLGVKSGGTVDVDAGQALASGWQTYERYMTQWNAAAITPTLLDAAQINFRSAT
jgi:hypothetical protein